MCILRNLSYRLALEVEAANVPIKGEEGNEGCTKDEDCWKRQKKKKKVKDAEVELCRNRNRHGCLKIYQCRAFFVILDFYVTYRCGLFLKT